MSKRKTIGARISLRSILATTSANKNSSGRALKKKQSHHSNIKIKASGGGVPLSHHGQNKGAVPKSRRPGPSYKPPRTAVATALPYPKRPGRLLTRPVPHGHAPLHPATATNAQPRAAPFRHANDSVVPQTSTCRPSPVPRVNNDAIKKRSTVAYFSYLCCLSAGIPSFVRSGFVFGFIGFMLRCCLWGAGSGERGAGGWLSDRANWRLKPVGKKRTIRVS